MTADVVAGPLVVVGDALLDVDIDGSADRLCPEAPVPVVDVCMQWQRPGGAGLAATLAAEATDEVILVCALGADDAGHTLRELLTNQVQVVSVDLRGSTVCKTRVRAGGQSVVRIDSGDGRAADTPIPEQVREVLSRAATVLVADYGRGVTAHPEIRDALAEAAGRVPVVWDPHPRGAPPVPGVRLVTPNRSEAAVFAPTGETPAERSRALIELWQADAVAVTLGAAGAVVSLRDEPDARSAPVPRSVSVSGSRLDTCGAGDRFAGTAAVRLMAGDHVFRAVETATAAAAEFVAAGGAAASSSAVAESDHPEPVVLGPGEDAFALAERMRRTGKRLVATGGCFDLLHPGHISLLRQARSLGDALVVCLNSDESVRRAKGPTRPVVSAGDRAKVLLELGSVDAVAIFDEPTPTELLDRLRPHVWVKGADYAGTALPEADTVQRHGGEVVFVPIVRGYSTSRIVAAARADA